MTTKVALAGAMGLLALVGTFSSSLTAATAQTAPAASATQAADGALDTGAPGPYAVGRSTFTLTDPAREGRQLLTDVWYPVDAGDAVGVPSLYDLLLTQLPSEVALADPVVSQAGPFPVVVFSHGSGGLRFQSYFLTETLASHGFVVIAPDHTGNTALDFLTGTAVPFAQSSVDRVGDVSFVIDQLLERNRTPGNALYRRVDPGRIGLAGHSFGGFTALAVASGYGGISADERVRAIVPISPATRALDDATLARIEIPTMVLGGTSDITVPLEPSNRRAFEQISSDIRRRVDVLDAGHTSFTNICDFVEAFQTVELTPELAAFLEGTASEGCAPELVPIEEAKRITNFHAVAFLLRHVAGERSYRGALRPVVDGAAPVPDVTYTRSIDARPFRCATVAPRPRCLALGP